MAEKWEIPESREINSPMFAGEKERDFQKQVNDELIEKVMNQLVIYYAIDYDATEYHPVYGEAINKTFFPPVKVMCVVEWMGEETTTDVFNVDKRPKIKIYFPHRRVTVDRELVVREGDFVKYGRDFYEIVKLNEDQELYGTFKYKVEIVAECVKAREDLFDVEEV
jgi:hypothetical protein